VPSHRVLVLAPTPGDATLTRSLLDEAGFGCQLCANVGDLVRELRTAVGALLLTDDVLADPDLPLLGDALQDQAAWSDVPILLLSAAGTESSTTALALEVLGNVTILERPVRRTTLVSALRTAVRARRRQYELREQLVAYERSQHALHVQNERLRLLWEAAAVLLAHDEPDTMLRGLFAQIAPHLQLDVYFNFMLDEGSRSLQLASCAGITEEQARGIQRLELGDAVCGLVAQERRPMIATFVQDSDEPRTAIIKSLGIRGYACNPLLAGDQLLGTLSFASRSRNRFEPDELEFLETITQYVTVAYERVRLIGQLRETDRRKDEFLATLAHELRNPLAPIRNALEIMRIAEREDGPLASPRKMIERQLVQMVRLIDDLLDVGRITQGKLELRRERVELAAVVRNAVETARPLLEAHGHRLTVTLPPDPVPLDADPVRLAQVFSNLLNNAAKYTDRNGRIALEATRDGDEVEIRVRDNGRGIPPEALPTIFEMFTQAHRSLEQSQGGLGIGLTLVQRLVEMHGGRVTAHSGGIGRGTEILVRLPAVPGTPAPARAAAPAGAAKSAEHSGTNGKTRILVADDNRDAAESMVLMLRLRGHDARAAHDGEQALEVARAFRPQVALLDIGMPRLNGYDVARRIREEPWGAGVLLVALTGWGQAEDKRRAVEAGFDRHYTKPVNPEDLMALIGRGENGASRAGRIEAH
jgi:signal transduction histidine kinase/ActR/RegA family two-component response regulator